MKQILKKIYTIIILIKNQLIHKKHYKLHFIAEQDKTLGKRWFYDFKHWGFPHENLEMVSGADELCEYYANGNDEVTVKIMASNKPIKNIDDIYDTFVGEEFPTPTFEDKYLFGRTYERISDGKEMWICPVTLFVLGRYPKYIYIKKKQ